MKHKIGKTFWNYETKRDVETFTQNNQDALYKNVETHYEDQPHLLSSLRDGNTELVWERAKNNKDFIVEIMCECYYRVLMDDDTATQPARELLSMYD